MRKARKLLGSEYIWLVLGLDDDNEKSLVISKEVAERLMCKERLSVVYNRKNQLQSFYEDEINAFVGDKIKFSLHADNSNVK